MGPFVTSNLLSLETQWEQLRVWKVLHDMRLHEPFTPARTLLQLKADNNPLMCVCKGQVWRGVRLLGSCGSFGLKYKRFIFSCSHFPDGLFHYNNFTISVLKIIFCLLNVSIHTVSKSEVNDRTKARPAALKDPAATPSRTYVLK